jgi:hypothetical protein
MGAALIAGLLTATAVQAQVPRCTKDMSRAGSICMDVYEASVWSIPASATSLLKKVQKGRATAADLLHGAATQLGVAGDDYAPCTDNGQTSCGDIYAVSIAGVTPSAFITWFQAQRACANSQKRLPRNGEWQQAVAGSPDPGGDNGTTDCNTSSAFAAVNTGARRGCVSTFGNFDMVGNVYEFVEDWMPLSTAYPSWGDFSNDVQCFAGASTTSGNTPGPGVLIRGGFFFYGSAAGAFAISGLARPTMSTYTVGFRCAR